MSDLFSISLAIVIGCIGYIIFASSLNNKKKIEESVAIIAGMVMITAFLLFCLLVLDYFLHTKWLFAEIIPFLFSS